MDLDPTRGREQGGRRPVVVVSDRRYAVIPGLFLAVPLTSTRRDLPHHVEVPADTTTGLTRTSYAMTEQIRALARDRVERQLGARRRRLPWRILSRVSVSTCLHSLSPGEAIPPVSRDNARGSCPPGQ